MPEPISGCKFSLEQRDWESENRWGGTELEWNAICDHLDLDDGVWHCPHDPIPTKDESDSQRCVFHTPPESVPRDIEENERFQEAIATATEDSDRSAQFLGATFDELRIDAIEPGCSIAIYGATVRGQLTISTTVPRKLYADRAVLHGRVSIDGATDDVSFKNTVWHQQADFTSAEFGGDIRFSAARFEDRVTFRRSSVAGNAEFTAVEFGGRADFFNCQFGSRAVFDAEVQFKQDALFQNACFEGAAEFEDASFKGEANFSTPRTDPNSLFGGEIIFKNAEFGAEADFYGRRFDDEANFAEAEFSGHATFDAASFQGPARFLYATFTGEEADAEVSFQQVEFEEAVDFEGAEFLASTRFAESTFHDVTLFRDVTFDAEVDFGKPDTEDVDRLDQVPQRVSFYERTIFNESSFGAGADLSDIDFNARVELKDTTFDGETTFDGAEYHAESVFVEATFNAPVSFQGSRFDRDVQFRADGQFAVSFESPPDFSQAKLSKADLRDARLQNADFTGTDLTEVNFQGADLTGARFEGALLSRANCFATDFQGAALNGAVMGDARINNATEFGFASSAADSVDRYCAYDPRYSSSEEAIDQPAVSLPAAISTYQLIEQLAADNGLDQLQSGAFVRRQAMRSREKAATAAQAEDTKTWLRAQFGRLLQGGSRIFMHYGERPKRVVGWWFVLIIAFSMLNLVVGVKPPDGGRLTLSQLIGSPSLISDLLYYTSLGFAGAGIDTLQPAGFWARLTAIATVFAGAILISLFVFALGRQTAR